MMNIGTVRVDKARTLRLILFGVSLLLWADLASCSRSGWMKPDGHEVSPKEQLVCAEQVRAATQDQTLSNEDLHAKIKTCMIDKGYHRRPWWLLNDLHWDVHPAL